MHRPYAHRSPIRFRLAPVLLLTLVAALWLAGGSSRADALGQVLVRGLAWAILIVTLVAGRFRLSQFKNPVFLFLCAAIGLALLQLIPLPPALWQELPGRDIFVEAAAASGQDQPWRPWSIVPAATMNAAAALIVPLVVFVLVTSLNEQQRVWIPSVLLGVIFTATILGLLQFSGAALDNPLINENSGQVSGIFANRNHFALLVAIGCLITPAWAVEGSSELQWRVPAAFGLLVLFTLTILAIGSRAGLLLGGVGLALGIILVRRAIKRRLRRYPRWIFAAAAVGLLVVLAVVVLISVQSDRAVSIQRAMLLDPEQDPRTRALPTIIAMIRLYFPVGSGLGGFDPLFRIHEPLGLLSFKYLNHVHNDFLEVVLDAGLPGLVLLLSILGWWIWASVSALRGSDGGRVPTRKLGSAVILLVLIASIVDYPARTPTFMAIIIVAGVWLSGRVGERTGSALPKSDQDL